MRLFAIQGNPVADARIVYFVPGGPCPHDDVGRLYGILSWYRDDARGMPVQVVVTQDGLSLATVMPGLYEMRREADVVLRSTGGVMGVVAARAADLQRSGLPN